MACLCASRQPEEYDPLHPQISATSRDMPRNMPRDMPRASRPQVMSDANAIEVNYQKRKAANALEQGGPRGAPSVGYGGSGGSSVQPQLGGSGGSGGSGPQYGPQFGGGGAGGGAGGGGGYGGGSFVQGPQLGMSGVGMPGQGLQGVSQGQQYGGWGDVGGGVGGVGAGSGGPGQGFGQEGGEGGGYGGPEWIRQAGQFSQGGFPGSQSLNPFP